MQDNQIAWDWIEAGPGWWSASMLAMDKRAADPFATFGLRADRDGGDPYEFWRQYAFKGFDAAARTAEKAQFHAAAEAIVSPRGEFISSTSRAIAGSRRKAEIENDGSRHVSLGIMLRGRRHAAIGDERITTGPGEIYAYDAASPIDLSLDDHHMAYLTLRREDVGLGPDPADLSSGAVQAGLNGTPLRDFLAMHLNSMVASGSLVESDRPGQMLSIALDLTHLLLHQCRKGPIHNVGALRRGLTAAAHRAIATHLANPELDANHLAALLGCTRATLYRAFADHQTSVAAHIRSLRLIKARHLLERSPANTTQEHILDQCGIRDGVHFSRQFRQFFGLRPSDIRGISAK